jgi:hypothetical protein
MPVSFPVFSPYSENLGFCSLTEPSSIKKEIARTKTEIAAPWGR